MATLCRENNVRNRVMLRIIFTVYFLLKNLRNHVSKKINRTQSCFTVADPASLTPIYSSYPIPTPVKLTFFNFYPSLSISKSLSGLLVPHSSFFFLGISLPYPSIFLSCYLLSLSLPLFLFRKIVTCYCYEKPLVYIWT